MRIGWAGAALAVVAAAGGGELAAQDRTGGGVVRKTYVLDYSQGMPARTNGRAPQLVRALPNARDERRSLVLTTPGTSRIVWRFAVPVRPSSAVLAIEHLSSGARARFGGSSIISVHLNGGCVVARWDVGSHGFASDRLRVDKFLEAGGNELVIRFEAGPTCYWFRKLSLACTFPPGTRLGEGGVRRIPAQGRADYAVVVRGGVYEDPGWRRVVDRLVEKHRAVVITYPSWVAEVRGELAAVGPKAVGFVAPPAEIGRRFVLDVHRMIRRLDDDPYGDALWGIVTGYTPADALALVNETRPLLVRRAAAGCSIDLTSFVEGVWYSEGEQGTRWVRRPGQAPVKQAAPADATAALVKALNVFQPDIFCTSGHASDRDWQIGYGFKSGQFRCARGELYGLDTRGRRHPIRSPNPKVYCPAGNCLMGLVTGREAMAVAWMRSGGARQMFGYTVSTWYGYAGHGTLRYFVNLQGRHTLAESFFFNNQALLERLQREFPGSLTKRIDDYDIESDPGRLDRIARRLKVRSKDELGLLWDRDTLAFYGDPAWPARVQRVREPDYAADLSHEELEDGRVRFTFRIVAHRDGRLVCPPAAWLPFRVRDVEVERGVEPAPVVTDDFVLVPVGRTFKRGGVRIVRFVARRRSP